jgi:hypothetical protein
MTYPVWQTSPPTVGDTVWVTRTVELPAGRSLRPADWEVADPVELLGAPRVTMRGGSADVSYPVAIWRAGTHTLQVPGPLLLAPDGGVDSLGAQTVTLTVASVLPKAATDTTLRPQPRADFVPRPGTSPVPLAILLLLAIALLAPLHWWWRRRGRPRPKPSAAEPAGHARPPLERWADAGESRAVAAAATSRLRVALASRVGEPLSPSLDTEAVMTRVAELRPGWPLDELRDVLRALDLARFGDSSVADAMAIANRAEALESRLVAEAA